MGLEAEKMAKFPAADGVDKVRMAKFVAAALSGFRLSALCGLSNFVIKSDCANVANICANYIVYHGTLRTC